eukprot:1645096-Karenia_brevis.AAC.1
MSVGADGVKPSSNSGIGRIMPPPAGDPMGVKQSVPMGFHMGPSGYAINSRSILPASSMTPNRVRFSTTTPSES